MKKRMYLLTDRPYGKCVPCAYCYNNGYYVYQVYREEKERYYDDKLFEKPEEVVEVLSRLRKDSGCQSIN